MGKKRAINPGEDASRELMRERGSILANSYLPCVRPIGIEYENERAELIGSAVLVTIAGRRFVLTAGHVADWADKGALMTGGREQFWMLPPLRTNAPPGKRTDDPFDIAVGELDPETAAGLGDVRFLELNDIDLESHVPSVPFYTVIGYPVIEQRLDAAKNHFNPAATVFSNVALAHADYPKLWKGIFTPAANLALRFDTSKVVTKDGIRALKDQQGLSGGGVFRFESLVDPTARDRLVGITIYAQTKTGTRALVATRVNFFLAAILHIHPELAPHVPISTTLRVRVREASSPDADPDAAAAHGI